MTGRIRKTCRPGVAIIAGGLAASAFLQGVLLVGDAFTAAVQHEGMTMIGVKRRISQWCSSGSRGARRNHWVSWPEFDSR